MRRLFICALLATTLTVSSGCIIPIFSGEKARRTQQLLFVSENFRLLLEEWERFWFLDHPDHMTPHRSDGGII